MLRILHLIDDSDPQELRLALGPLLERLRRSEWHQSVAIMSGRGEEFPFLSDRTARRIPLRFGLPFLSAPAIKHTIRREGVDVLHAWSMQTAAAAIMATDGKTPVVLTRWNPRVTRAEAKRIHMVAARHRTGILCHTDMVKRRLIEGGLPIERCVTVRPGVDFSVINKLRRAGRLKETLRIEPQSRVVLMPDVVVGRRGCRLGLLAMAVARQLMPELLLLLPGPPQRVQKLLRFAAHVSTPPFAIAPAGRHSIEELLSACDLLLVPAMDDISTTAIVWAMAGGVPIVACANLCATEFLADGHNGLLVKPDEPTMLAGKILRATQQPRENYAMTETARGQAFEALGLTRYVEQTQQAYENLLSARPVSADIVDSALQT